MEEQEPKYKYSIVYRGIKNGTRDYMFRETTIMANTRKEALAKLSEELEKMGFDEFEYNKHIQTAKNAVKRITDIALRGGFDIRPKPNAVIEAKTAFESIYKNVVTI